MLILSSAEGDIYDVFKEVSSLAGRWRSMCLALGLLPSDEATIALRYCAIPDECLRSVLVKWLKMDYKIHKHGRPTWQKLVAAVADRIGGGNPALAQKIAKKHQGKVSTNCKLCNCARKVVSTEMYT